VSKDLTGLGDLDIEELDRKRREKLREQNPNNEPAIFLERWTLAHLTRDDRVVSRVVFGVVIKTLTDDYIIGEIVCSQQLLDVPQHQGRKIFVSRQLRYECTGPGREVTIDENELKNYFPNSDSTVS